MSQQTLTVHFLDDTITDDQKASTVKKLMNKINKDDHVKDHIKIKRQQTKDSTLVIPDKGGDIDFFTILIEYSYIALPFLLEYLVSFMVKRRDENAKVIVHDNEKNKIEITSTLIEIDDKRKFVLTGLSKKERAEVIKKVLEK